jgi:ABC-type transport system involved in cytochrome c biogenesis permease subunit
VRERDRAETEGDDAAHVRACKEGAIVSVAIVSVAIVSVAIVSAATVSVAIVSVAIVSGAMQVGRARVPARRIPEGARSLILFQLSLGVLRRPEVHRMKTYGKPKKSSHVAAVHGTG